jgi:hypothetical protein
LIEQISYDDTKKYIKIITNDKWQNICSKQNTKLNEIKGDTTQLYNSSLKRKEETVINRLRIGHTRITYGFLMAKEERHLHNLRNKSHCQAHHIGLHKV